jgi:cyclic pyranopterin phosphate synthase
MPGHSATPLDTLGRPLGSLRLPVTDRCNMRCRYCMPEDEYAWLPRSSILTFEELTRLAGIFAGLGTGKVRLTGGEPLLRHGIQDLVSRLSTVHGVHDLALTTNGILLAAQAEALRSAGLNRVTISLDTLRPERMKEFARSDRHAEVIAGVDAAVAAGFDSVKINSVVIRGYNDDEILPLLEFARARRIEIRFIEYMDVGGATRWSQEQVLAQADLLSAVGTVHGSPEALPARAAAPAERYRLADGTVFGVIASTTAPFCRDCDRSRLTADGTWYLCLYATEGINLRDVLRDGATDAEITKLIRDRWAARSDRGAEERLAVPARGVLYQVESLRADPRREMHTRGG